MNTGQTMLTIAALALLSVITLRYYSSIAQSGRNLATSKSGLTATTIATSLMERAQSLGYDELTTGSSNPTTFRSAAYFTDPVQLGIPKINKLDEANDFDDFNAFVDTIQQGSMNEKFIANFDVYYVNPSDLQTKVYVRTFVKRMDVKVWRIYPPLVSGEGTLFDTGRASTIMGYFKYN